MRRPPKSPMAPHRPWRHQRISTSSSLPVGRRRARGGAGRDAEQGVALVGVLDRDTAAPRTVERPDARQHRIALRRRALPPAAALLLSRATSASMDDDNSPASACDPAALDGGAARRLLAANA